MSIQFLITAIVVVLAPGTGVIYTLAIGVGQGRRAAFWAAAVLHASALLFQIVKFAGVAYLLWLAWQALKDGGALAVQSECGAQPGWRVAWRGMLINVLNPKLSIFFLALLPPFLSGDPTSVTREMVLLGGVFMALTFVVFVGYGLFAAQARSLILGNARLMRWINRGFAAIFAALAGRLALERV